MLNLALDSSLPRPLVEQLATSLRQHIESRLLRAGMRLPSIRELAGEQRVSRFTVIEAYDRLIASGHIESRRGSGFYVAAAPTQDTAVERTGRLTRAVDVANLIGELYADDGLMKFASGCLPDSWLAESGIRKHLRALAAHPGGHLTEGGSAAGYRPLREQLQRRLADFGIGATPDQILLTQGVTHGLDLLIRYLLSPGDTVLVEDPGYYNLTGHLKLSGVTPIGISRTAEGPDLDALENAIARYLPKALFTVSVLQNPTSTTLSAARAHRLLQIAERHRLTIVEDDIYADWQPGAPARLAAFDRLERVFYLGGFSKTVSSSLRVGFVAAHPDAIADLTRMKLLTFLNTSEASERLIHAILVGGHYRKHLDRMRAKLDVSRARMIRDLERVGWKVDTEPAGGMLLWARHPHVTDSLPIAEAAVERGMRLAAGAAFRPNHESSPFLRFNLAVGGSPGLYALLAEAPRIAGRSARPTDRTAA
jgi:DNA-binding transcriptional MocR family regulator